MSSPCAKKKKEVRAAMESMNRQVQSKRREAASILLLKTGTKGMGTLLFYVIGSIMNMRRPAKVVHWREKRHDDSREECEPTRHLWLPCLSLCKLRACSQTNKETHCCGISPTCAGKKEKVRTGIESTKEEAESKSQVPARSCFENGC